MRSADRSDLQQDIARFYYREARLLDERRFLTWLDLLAPEIVYRIPARHNYVGENSARNTEQYHSLAHELSPPEEAPIRRDNLALLTVRAQRALAPQAWSDNPPPRTRRMISNIEPDPDADPGAGSKGDLRVYSNFLLSFSHHSADNHLYTGQRRDVLRPQERGFLIVERTIILDWNVITAPTLALFF
ncbi:MAG: Biphenyl 2,3-dioxygenase subunit beta [Steroidobacteraceae bacterium]|nr:Biphenyl 2,3-dioxygenase subunit beta [Steroidobacteraceae bacterium]